MQVNRSEHAACEQQAKFLQERVSLVESHFADLHKVLGAYGRKLAGIKEKNNDIAKAIQKYAEGENVNTTLSNSLKEFAAIVFEISAQREVQVRKIETEILPQFSDYSVSCKHLKAGVKDVLMARNNEVAKKRQLDHVKERSSRNRQQLISAETEFAKASSQAAQSIKQFEDAADSFENKKLNDIKHNLLNYVKTELRYHVKGIKLYTAAYQKLLTINVEGDLQDYRNALHAPESVSRLETVRRTSFKLSLANLFSTPSTSGCPPSASESNSENSKANKPDGLEFLQQFETDTSDEEDAEEDNPVGRSRNSL